jgi:hypothetical protein
MSSVINIKEETTYREEMKSNCKRWAKSLEKKHIPISSAWDSFNENYPNEISYVGFFKSLKAGTFSYDNYVKVRTFFNQLENN